MTKKKIKRRQLERLHAKLMFFEQDLQAVADNIERLRFELQRNPSDAFAAFRRAHQSSSSRTLPFTRPAPTKDMKFGDFAGLNSSDKRSRIRESIDRQEAKIQSILGRLRRDEDDDSSSGSI